MILMSSLPVGDLSQYYLTTDAGSMYRLDFCDGLKLETIAPNSRVTISYSRITDGVMYSCQQPQQVGVRRALMGDTLSTPDKPTILVYVVTLCGYDVGPAATPEQVTNLLTGDGNGRTLAKYYDACSYKQVSLNSAQVKVLGPEEIPCSGSLNLPFTFPSGNIFDTKSCNNDNMIKWHYYLDTVAARRGITATDYNHKVILLPQGYMALFPGCNGVSGSASIGPWLREYSDVNKFGTGLVWWAGDSFGSLEILFHEIGHTLGMAHASVPDGCDLIDQCDHTCPMGAIGGQGIRCLNAPHLDQLGWGQPFRDLSDKDFPTGAKQLLTIPPQMTTSRSFVRLDFSPRPGSRKLYAAARINTPPYDLPYGINQNGQPFIVVHSWNGTSTNKYVRTILLADVELGDMFVDDVSGLVITFVDWDDKKGASATFCRRKGPKEKTCGDGIDDDCDNLVDENDPDCAGRMPGGAQSDRPVQAPATRSPSPPPRGAWGGAVRLPPPSPPPPSPPPPPPPSTPPPRRPPPPSPLSPLRRPPFSPPPIKPPPPVFLPTPSVSRGFPKPPPPLQSSSIERPFIIRRHPSPLPPSLSPPRLHSRSPPPPSSSPPPPWIFNPRPPRPPPKEGFSWDFTLTWSRSPPRGAAVREKLLLFCQRVVLSGVIWNKANSATYCVDAEAGGGSMKRVSFPNTKSSTYIEYIDNPLAKFFKKKEVTVAPRRKRARKEINLKKTGGHGSGAGEPNLDAAPVPAADVHEDNTGADFSNIDEEPQAELSDDEHGPPNGPPESNYEAVAKVYLQQVAAARSLLMLMSSIHGGQDASKYYLRQDDGQMYSLSFCSELGPLGLVSNLRVQVNYNRIEDGVMYSCQIPVPLGDDSPSSTPVSASKRRELFGPTISTPKRPTFLIYIVTLCGFSQPAVATASRMRDFFFRNNSISLSGYYDTCSYGQISVLPEQVEIVTGLEIPCNGTLNLPFSFPTGNKFDTRNCENDNLLKWQYYLDDVVSDMGITPTDFHHKVIYLPPTFVGYRCDNFTGTASLGPWIKTDSKINEYGTGLIWMAGDVFPNIEYFFHEVGHTLSMGHATIPNGCDSRDQCDHTCPMGPTDGQGIRCLNAPHMWQLGWSQPMRRLTESDLPYGASQEILIPRQMSTKDSYVVVSGVRGLVPTDAMYFAVRMNEYPYELPFEVNEPYIVVHSYNGTSTVPYMQTVLLGEISVNNRFVHNTSKVVVKFIGWDAVRGATARFCRRSSTREQTCGDGLDDDCDFLPDELDPDCAGRPVTGNRERPPRPPPQRSYRPPTPRPSPPRPGGLQTG
ncbi:hypothetical protein VOLCADRAFT_96075 [Volvox carteri f. nagariensis]|uniref:Peptidase M11 gametolysin domain-containing protein n=1 Tax=Volvox carteri f. nagariensis TaxID=3068 RepID=D8U952_VOLCA|nr:uncharacterized protein VOLCADRAFT_96075 [Volvox carteri f. nagariensis]EFJ43690.1 hypothetical protein VOLCADRAFT_96075 [Volvox carteri f. nagariensis]|eukprot:XP_002955171.1 hypothetical protein VOLCADRAFT_96075 [Volvox carteri f. nagariensis]